MRRLQIAFIVVAFFGHQALADSVASTCALVPPELTEPPPESARAECTFSQRQGFIDIWFEDGTVFEFEPIEGIGNFVDGEGMPVYRRAGLGSDGEIFDTRRGRLYIWWE